MRGDKRGRQIDQGIALSPQSDAIMLRFGELVICWRAILYAVRNDALREGLRGIYSLIASRRMVFCHCVPDCNNPSYIAVQLSENL